jgi:hypothetical protein
MLRSPRFVTLRFVESGEASQLFLSLVKPEPHTGKKLFFFNGGRKRQGGFIPSLRVQVLLEEMESEGW